MDLFNTLVEELRSDPLDRGYEEMTNLQVVASLNTANRNVYKKLTSLQLLSWAAENGRLDKLVVGSTNQSLTSRLRSICRAAVLLIERFDAGLDLTSQEHSSLLTEVVLTGVLSNDDATSLATLATEIVSRGIELGLREVGMGDVVNARKVINGNG